MLSSSYRYSRWDGTQNIFDVDASELMDHLSDDLLNHGDVWKALRELMRRGMGQQTPGLKDLMEQLKERQQQQLQQYNLDSVMEDLKERLDQILKAEREGIQTRLDEVRREINDAEGPERAQMEELNKLLQQRAQRNLEKLDNLPQSPGGTVRELMEYDFIDSDAQQMFQELLDMLRGQMASNVSQDMMEQLRNMTPEQMSELREMLRDRLEGREPDFEGFMRQFGPMFGPNPPSNLEDLLERMMGQPAQMQSLMDSMSPEARQELEDVLASALDPETRLEMVRLASFLEQLLPMDELRRQYPFLGDDSLTLERAMELMGKLQGMDELERSIQEAMRTGGLDEIDPEKLQEHLGEEARRTWEQLQRLMELLKEEGYITDDSKPELTPKAIRRIGQRALKEVFINLRKDRVGDHQMADLGSGGDALTQTKQYEFGDPFQLDLNATVKNALVRAGPQVPVRLDPRDFEIYQTEHFSRAATVVLLDQSRSMGLMGNFQAAKKVAMALYALIHSQFPRDSLYVIGFSDYAREIREEELPKVSWNSWVSGTNMHHALILARKILSKEKGGTRQVILITDGEPTAHLEGDQAYFGYPPSRKTILETLKEARRCTQADIAINTFMLENSYQLIDFVGKMTRINRGRAFYATSDRLGEYVLVDYVSNRRKRLQPPERRLRPQLQRLMD